MIWSKYNRFYKISSNTYAIYNYAWNKAVFVVPKLKKIIEEHIDLIDSLKTIHPTLFVSLVNGKFVTDDLNEEKIVKNHIQEKLSFKKILRLTINPTLDCNLRCWYCYEVHKNKSYMDENIITSIYKFVQSRINGNVEEVHLSFFGGEPILTANKRAIPISQEITRICKEARKRISLHFTTNGTLLKSEVISQIANLQVPTSFQIAFDGDRDLHNKTKKWGHLSTYDVVLANVKRVLQNHMRVNVRCNYTLDNISSFYQLIDDIKGLMDCSLLPICTICSQTHIESSSALCPVEISDEDKE